MIGALHKTEKFKEDIKRYNDAIDLLSDDNLKSEARSLVNNLLFEVKKMDNMYSDMVYNRQLNSTGNEFRENISLIRKRLEEKLFKKR